MASRVLHGDRGDEPEPCSSDGRCCDRAGSRPGSGLGVLPRGASVTRLIWRNDEVGQAGLRLPDSETEIVLSQNLPYAPNWLVTSVSDAAADIAAAGGVVVVEPHEIAVGRLAVVADPFGNSLILLDLSNGRYAVDDTGRVTGVEAIQTADRR